MKATIYIGRGTPTVTIARVEIDLPAPGETVTVATSEAPIVLAWDPDMCLSATGCSVRDWHGGPVTPWSCLRDVLFEECKRHDAANRLRVIDSLRSAASGVASRQLRGALAGLQALIRIEEGIQGQPERAGDLAAYQRAAKAIEETLAMWPHAERGTIRTAMWRR